MTSIERSARQDHSKPHCATMYESHRSKSTLFIPEHCFRDTKRCRTCRGAFPGLAVRNRTRSRVGEPLKHSSAWMPCLQDPTLTENMGQSPSFHRRANAHRRKEKGRSVRAAPEFAARGCGRQPTRSLFLSHAAGCRVLAHLLHNGVGIRWARSCVAGLEAGVAASRDGQEPQTTQHLQERTHDAPRRLRHR
jgi:hypothetical protein